MKNWTKNKGETTLKHVEKIGIMPRISKNLHLLGEAAVRISSTYLFHKHGFYQYSLIDRLMRF